jgi:hypothetical protein
MVNTALLCVNLEIRRRNFVIAVMNDLPTIMQSPVICHDTIEHCINRHFVQLETFFSSLSTNTSTLKIRGPSLSRVLMVACFLLVPCFTYSWTLKMEVTCSSETSADFRDVDWYISGDRTVRILIHCTSEMKFALELQSVIWLQVTWL